MNKSKEKTNWSTIKFPREFVSDLATFSRANGWKSSSEYIMATVRYARKYQIDLHGEDSTFHQTTATQMLVIMKSVSESLKGIPERMQLTMENNQLKVELMVAQKDISQLKKAQVGWKQEADIQMGAKNEALEKIDNLQHDVSIQTERANHLDSKLHEITEKVKNCLLQIEDEKPIWRRQSKRLRKAIIILNWIISEVNPPP